MKALALALTLAALLTPTLVVAAGHFPNSGEELLPIATRMAFMSSLKEPPPIPADQVTSFTWTLGFISGTAQAIHAQAYMDGKDVSCMDLTKLSTDQVAMAMVAFATKHPEVKAEPPIAVVWQAVLTEYPCLRRPAKH